MIAAILLMNQNQSIIDLKTRTQKPKSKNQNQKPKTTNKYLNIKLDIQHYKNQ